MSNTVFTRKQVAVRAGIMETSWGGFVGSRRRPIRRLETPERKNEPISEQQTGSGTKVNNNKKDTWNCQTRLLRTITLAFSMISLWIYSNPPWRGAPTLAGYHNIYCISTNTIEFASAVIVICSVLLLYDRPCSYRKSLCKNNIFGICKFLHCCFKSVLQPFRGYLLWFRSTLVLPITQSYAGKNFPLISHGSLPVSSFRSGVVLARDSLYQYNSGRGFADDLSTTGPLVEFHWFFLAWYEKVPSIS